MSNEALAQINHEMKEILTEVMPLMESHMNSLVDLGNDELTEEFGQILELIAGFIKGATLLRNYLRQDGAF